MVGRIADSYDDYKLIDLDFPLARKSREISGSKCFLTVIARKASLSLISVSWKYVLAVDFPIGFKPVS